MAHQTSPLLALAWLAGCGTTAPAHRMLGCEPVPAERAWADGGISGTVVDAQTHRPFADLVVTLRSAALTSEQVAATDESGEWSVDLLPDGLYKIEFQRGDATWVTPFNVLADQGHEAHLWVQLAADGRILVEESVAAVDPRGSHCR